MRARKSKLLGDRSSTDYSDLEQPSSYLVEQGTRRVGNSGDAPGLSSRRTQSSLTVSEVLTRRNRVGDTVTAEAWNHLAGMVSPTSFPLSCSPSTFPFSPFLSFLFPSALACVTQDYGDWG